MCQHLQLNLHVREVKWEVNAQLREINFPNQNPFQRKEGNFVKGYKKEDDFVKGRNGG